MNGFYEKHKKKKLKFDLKAPYLMTPVMYFDDELKIVSLKNFVQPTVIYF